MTAPSPILSLIERFDRNRDAYRSGQYNETQVRREFIDPFFEALGWDVNNRQGYAEAYKDVIHEDAIKVGGATKAPDYCFRIGGTRKFFVEAKKPSVNIERRRQPGLPAPPLRLVAPSCRSAILTDFEEFAVYDCRGKPDKSDKASTGRVLYLHLSASTPTRWDEIAGVFSREADPARARSTSTPRRTRASAAPPRWTTRSCGEIERWRDAAGAQPSPCATPALSQRELNYAVQQTIDRIIFLRICEDRGHRAVRHAAGAAQRRRRLRRGCCELFRQADDALQLRPVPLRSRRRTAPKRPTTLTPRPGDRRQAAQGHPRAASTTPTAPTSSPCCRPTSWARSTSSSWAR